MFILNPYDHYLQKTSKKTGVSGVAQKPTSNSTNNSQAITMSRRLMDSITRGRKAYPIVSITTASGSNPSVGVAAGQNCIPFPSLPVPISVPGKRVQSPTYHEIEHGVICIDSQATTEWTFDVHTVSPGLITKAQFQSRLAEASRLPISGPGKLPVRKRLGSGTQVSKPDDDLKKVLQERSPRRRTFKRERSGEGGRKRAKVRKRTVAPDVKFLIALYKSITWCIECAEKAATDVDNKNFGTDEFAQDKLLAEKIFSFLVERGFNPLSPPSSMDFEQPSLSIEIPSIDHDPCAPIPFPLLPSQPSISPTDESPSSPASPLTMSQIVASLILRHRERASASRLRLSSGQMPSRRRTSVAPDRKSPLSNVLTAEV